MALETHPNLDQGSDEWLQLRTGLITASEMGLILTPTLKIANNDKTRAHVWEIAAQRITGWTEPTFIGWNGERGHADEVVARDLYSTQIEPVEQVGFYIRDMDGVKVGYSPDGVCMMGNKGIEVKSRKQKYQVEVIATNEVPQEHRLQLQTALFVTGWDCIDYVSFSGGMPLWVIPTEPDETYQAAIEEAVLGFEEKVKDAMSQYQERIGNARKVIETERQDHDMEMVIT